MTTKKIKREYLEQAGKQICLILSELEQNPYAYNRSLNDCKEYLWKVCSWKNETVQFGLTRKEYDTLWNNLLMFYDIGRYISYEEAMSFYMNIKMRLYGNPLHADRCSLTEVFISKLMNISLEETEAYFYAMKFYKITEKQGMGLVF